MRQLLVQSQTLTIYGRRFVICFGLVMVLVDFYEFLLNKCFIDQENSIGLDVLRCKLTGLSIAEAHLTFEAPRNVCFAEKDLRLIYKNYQNRKEDC